MLSAVKGLAYLQANEFLHWGFKPDNVIVFSLDTTLEVNGKLTDYGSSRNVNSLITNMTFTKGIGSPTYMAPEVLNKKCKSPADVFSFGVTMLEMLKWARRTRRLSSSTRGRSHPLSRLGSGLRIPMGCPTM